VFLCHYVLIFIIVLIVSLLSHRLCPHSHHPPNCHSNLSSLSHHYLLIISSSSLKPSPHHSTTPKMKEIAISILNAPILTLQKELDILSQSHPQPRIHLDIIDTSFTNNISFGPSIINQILQLHFQFDLHFMIKSPLALLTKIDCTNVSNIYMHEDVQDYGIAINPDEPVVYKQKVLVMTVYAGEGNQAFISPGDKIAELKRQGCYVCVDGGVNLENVGSVRDADCFVIGSAYFRSKDKNAFLNSVYEIVNG
ncbi:D-ribulose-5-phosphate 3-epimerase, partial [Trachipleistophora hominis]